MADIELVKGASLKKEETEGKERFRVALISMAAEIRTIYAKDGNEAVELCAEKGLGRPAGTQGPKVISIAASSYADSPDAPDFIQLAMNKFVEAGAAAQHARESQIMKPNIVLPPGFDPKGPKGA